MRNATACPTPTKVAYDTQAKAKRAARLVSNTIGHGLKPYFCTPCRRWHLASKK